jgi:hypothetical protein
MHGDEAPDQCQPDAQASLRPPALSTHLSEHLEDRLEMGTGNSDSIVAHGDRRLVSSPRDRDDDGTAVGSISGRIGEEVREDLGEAHRIAGHRDRLGRHLHRQGMLGGIEQRPAGFHRGANNRHQVDGFMAHLDHAPRDARDFEQIFDQADEVTDLALHDIAHVRRHWVVKVRKLEQLGRSDQRRKRIAQLVAEHCEELVPFAGRLRGAPARHARDH